MQWSHTFHANLSVFFLYQMEITHAHVNYVIFLTKNPVKLSDFCAYIFSSHFILNS